MVIDGMTEAMVLHSLDPDHNADVARFMATLPRVLTKTGASVIVIDHVTKARESRGRYAIGAQHKLAAIDKTTLVLSRLLSSRSGGSTTTSRNGASSRRPSRRTSSRCGTWSATSASVRWPTWSSTRRSSIAT